MGLGVILSKFFQVPIKWFWVIEVLEIEGPIRPPGTNRVKSRDHTISKSFKSSFVSIHFQGAFLSQSKCLIIQSFMYKVVFVPNRIKYNRFGISIVFDKSFWFGSNCLNRIVPNLPSGLPFQGPQGTSPRIRRFTSSHVRLFSEAFVDRGRGSWWTAASKKSLWF